MDVRFELYGTSFAWSSAKAAANSRKHGVRFEDAATAFGDPMLVLVDASRNDETRDAVIGFDAAGRLLYVVHIEFADDAIRLISARRATPEEEQRYVE